MMTCEKTNDALWEMLRDVQFMASKGRMSNRKACDFFHLGIDAQIEFFNDHILPLWERMGRPERGTPEYHGFELALFIEEIK